MSLLCWPVSCACVSPIRCQDERWRAETLGKFGELRRSADGAAQLTALGVDDVPSPVVWTSAASQEAVTNREVQGFPLWLPTSAQVDFFRFCCVLEAPDPGSCKILNAALGQQFLVDATTSPSTYEVVDCKLTTQPSTAGNAGAVSVDHHLGFFLLTQHCPGCGAGPGLRCPPGCGVVRPGVCVHVHFDELDLSRVGRLNLVDVYLDKGTDLYEEHKGTLGKRKIKANLHKLPAGLNLTDPAERGKALEDITPASLVPWPLPAGDPASPISTGAPLGPAGPRVLADPISPSAPNKHVDWLEKGDPCIILVQRCRKFAREIGIDWDNPAQWRDNYDPVTGVRDGWKLRAQQFSRHRLFKRVSFSFDSAPASSGVGGAGGGVSTTAGAGDSTAST